MVKIRPTSVLDLMPVDDVINHSLRYLKVDAEDRATRCRVVLLPFGSWGDCGLSMGRASMPSTSPTTPSSSLHPSLRTPRLVLPPSNSMIECPRIVPLVDNGVIDHILDNMVMPAPHPSTRWRPGRLCSPSDGDRDLQDEEEGHSPLHPDLHRNLRRRWETFHLSSGR